MSAHAVSTALQYDLPFTWVAMNDSALDMMRHHQAGRQIASGSAQTDHGAMAGGFGAYGMRVNDSRGQAAAYEKP